MIDAKDTNFGCNELRMTVTINGEEKKLSCDAPDEKNELQGSQIYRGIKDNDIQPGDTFIIGHGGRMDNKYKTTIYGISKVHTDSAPQKEDSEPEVNIDEIPF